MIYIITTETFPNGLAATQRIKCYAKAIVECGESCEILCVNRCEDLSHPLGNTRISDEIDGYKYRYIGNSTIKPVGRYKGFITRIHDVFLLCCLLLTFSKKEKIILYSYNRQLMRLVLDIAKFKHYKVYYEINEHPSIQLGRIDIDDDNLCDLNKLYNYLYRFDGCLCISNSIQLLLNKAGIPLAKTHIVNMAVDEKRFKGLVKQSVGTYIAYCGAADNNKDGVDQLIKAFAKISNKHPEVKLYIIGPKREDCNNEKLAAELGVINKVVFTGMINPCKMPQMLVNASLCALNRPNSRQAKYGFPTKLGEYLLSGTPVVITKVGDIPLHLKHGHNAYLSDPDDIDDFANKMDTALSNLSIAKIVGELGKQYAETEYSMEKIRTQLKHALNI